MPRLQVGVRQEQGAVAQTLPSPVAGEQVKENSKALVAPPGRVAAQAARAAPPASSAEIDALIPDREIQISLPPQPAPQFIDTVFGEILRVPYVTGPGVAQRRELIALRGPTTMSSRQFFAMAQLALQQYGMAVLIDRGVVRIVRDDVASGQSPEIVRARAATDAPSGARSILQIFPVSSLDAQALVSLLETVYPSRGSARITVQAETNSLLISGSVREVASSIEVLRQLDQPHFAGGQIARVQPVFMSAGQMQEALTRVLTTEGYLIGGGAEGRARALSILPIESVNQLLVFANDPAVFERALYWARELDKASAQGDGEGVFVYQVRNTNAEDLSALVSGARAASTSRGAVTAAPPEEVARRTNGVRTRQPFQQASGAGDEITVDAGGNRILFRGSPTEYGRLVTLLEQLDTPPQQVLVELTIAEVTLTDETRFGVEWFLDQTITDGTLSVTTRGGAVRQAGGLGVAVTNVFSRGRVEAALTAFASNNNLNILSTPRLVTRSGSEAQILIGTDVPIITSQRASNSQTSGDSDILQTVQYRQTGVILNVRPIVFGDDRIDISLYQEVSSQQPNTTAAISSPLILNRSVSTQLSLREGMTAVIGGLIQDNYSRDQRGVPLLKDVPLVGQAFRSDRVSGDKVELLILVTPYIIRDDDDIGRITNALSSSLDRQLRVRGPQVFTLYPWRRPLSGARTHGAGTLGRKPGDPVAPDATPASEPELLPPQDGPAPPPEGVDPR